MTRDYDEEISETGNNFFEYVQEKDRNWRKTWTKQDLRECYTNEYKPARREELVGISFSNLMYELRGLGKVRFKRGRVFYHERVGIPRVDQHRHLPHRQQSRTVQQDTNHVANERTYPVQCPECNVPLNSQSQHLDHVNGSRHRLRLTTLFVRRQEQSLLEDKYDVTVKSGEGEPFQDGKKTVSSRPGDSETVSLIVHCGSTPVSLTMVSLLSQDSRLSIQDKEGLAKGKVVLKFQSGQKYTIKVTCKSDNFGEISAPVAFAFQLENKTVFHILRLVTFITGGDDYTDLAPTAPYTRPAKVAVTPLPRNVLSGTPAQFSSSGELPQTVQMPKYNVPESVSQDLNSDAPASKLTELEEPLSAENYSQKFKTLLYAEEHQMMVDIRRYDRKGVTMTPSKKYEGLLNLNVPGLAENRPSILKGDHLFVTFANGSKPDRAYKGYVHHVEEERVSLCFHKDLMDAFIPGLKFDVQFTFSRFPMRSSHFAVDSEQVDMDRLQPVLFPEPKKFKKVDAGKLASLGKKLHDQKLASNVEQVQAIYHILNGSSLPAPYLVFGPPGTGKTVTVVEAMKQVYKQNKKHVILACAPTNSAADLISKRLVENGHVTRHHLLRMCALSRAWDSVDPALQDIRDDCLNFDRFNYVVFPSPEKIKEKRIVVVTFVTACRLVLSDAFQNHFTHIFLDEAGHAIEPEALISVTGLLPKNGQLVLAGDPKQLGPVLRSPISKEYGLEMSLLERFMMNTRAYQRQDGAFNERMLTKLLCNYRSHPSILQMPNEMFYEGELKECADKLVRECLMDIGQLPATKFPIIFHGIDGKDEREEHSPSFFNVAEAEQVWQYISYLLNLCGHKKVRGADIGVISPYRRQVQKIRQILGKKKRKNRRADLTDIKVGSVEEFQGQERLVIIISTVRSTKKEYVQMDEDYKLGFLRNPKRFNVAVTRAKALLICIGNPYMLRLDEHWNKFLEYCRRNGGYKGCPYDPDIIETEIDELNSKLANLNIAPETMTEDEAAASRDEAWRGGEHV